MISIRVHYQNGDHMETQFNGTSREALKYYVGRTFNIGTAGDNLQVCSSIELLRTADDGKLKEAGSNRVNVRTLCNLINGLMCLIDNGNGQIIAAGSPSDIALGSFSDCAVETVTNFDNDAIALWIPRA